MSEFKIVWQCWLDVNSISRSTRKSTVTAYTVRFSPVWNPVMEGMITIRTLPTVCTQFIHSIFKPGPNVIIQNKVKITDMNKNNYYNTKLSDIQLAKSLWWVKGHNIYIYIRKLKKWNVNSPVLKLPLQNLKWTDSEVFARGQGESPGPYRGHWVTEG